MHIATDCFAKAVEQLGSDRLETRLGAVYTLERIAGESQREYWPIMETLTAFVRERAPCPDENATEQTGAQIRPSTDIQAVLTVLGRRDEQARRQDEAAGRGLDLAGTDLRGANLRGARLQGANLAGARLEGANLAGARLQGAWLPGARLQGAFLEGAHLQGANLRVAVGLTRERLAEAFGDARTKVAKVLRPGRWPAAAPEEPDNPRQQP